MKIPRKKKPWRPTTATTTDWGAVGLKHSIDRGDGRVILVTGSRDWPEDKAHVIEKALFKLIIDLGVRRYEDVCVVAGGADGVDTWTRHICTREKIAFAEFPAPWDFFTKQLKANSRPAGPIRNGWMIRWMRPDAVLAFHPYLPGSRGTKDCVEQARKAGVKLIRVVAK